MTLEDEETFEPMRKSRSQTSASKVNSGKQKRLRNTASMGYTKHARAGQGRHPWKKGK